MAAYIWPLLIYWLVMFVACYVVVEVAQDQFYDEVTPNPGLKVGAASLILAIMLTWLHPSFESMFTTGFIWTILQGIVWFAVFTLILQFHPWHALGLGIVTMLIVTGLATMGVDSLMAPRVTQAPVRASQSIPVRRPIGQASGKESIVKGVAPAKAAPAPAKVPTPAKAAPAPAKK
jgi:hypothetical protein